jgi:hypothetical protein
MGFRYFGPTLCIENKNVTASHTHKLYATLSSVFLETRFFLFSAVAKHKIGVIGRSSDNFVEREHLFRFCKWADCPIQIIDVSCHPLK